MIHSIKNICNLLAGLLLLVSCSDETPVGPKEITVEEGLPVTVNLAFGTSDPVKIETRATDISENDKIHSLAVFVFEDREPGTYNENDEKKVGETFFFNLDGLEGTIVPLRTTTGYRRLYAVANYKSSTFGDLTAVLAAVKSSVELANVIMELQDNNISLLDDHLLMSGEFGNEGEENLGRCVITENGIVNRSGNPGAILLRRSMASVKFKVYTDTPGATFFVDSWQVKNLPQTSFVLGESRVKLNSKSYFNTKESSVFVEEEDKKTFSFLMMENQYFDHAELSTYDEREKMSAPEVFVNAPKNSTYVILKGTFSGKTSAVDEGQSDRDVTAHVTYYIHLGTWNQPGFPDEPTYGNFDIANNSRYTYTVRVKGVDDLIVEVQTDKENWSGDGDMFVSTKENARTFDAHYETTIISFTKKQIGELRAKYSGSTAEECSKEVFKQKFLIYASTPKNDFTSDASDVDWVTYRRNTEGNVATDFMKYKASSTDNTLLDAEKFKEDLYNVYDEASVPEDGTVYYTCFIDEYFYGDLSGNYSNTVMELSKFVNQQPRILQICTNYIKNNEPSSTSSISTAAYTFLQRSIYTIYDIDRMENNVGLNGWGTEWTQEGDNLPVASIFGHRVGTMTSLSQGRYATWTNLLKSEPGFHGTTAAYTWSNYLDYKTNTMTHRYADYACLTRNRDLNGNGQIDSNELRWYLPAINQYVEFVMGAGILPDEITLADRNKYDPGQIYVSSSAWRFSNVADTEIDVRVLKANEGSSTVFCGTRNTNPYPYRCIRSLVNVVASSTPLVTPGEGVLNDGKTYKYLYFDNLNPLAKRVSVSFSLTYGHTNFDEESRVSDGIEVSEQFRLDGLNAQKATQTNPCKEKLGDGWRLPNQLELTVLTSNLKNAVGGGVPLFSCTQTKYPPLNKSTIYFGYGAGLGGDMKMWNGNQTAYFRCVRDIKR